MSPTGQHNFAEYQLHWCAKANKTENPVSISASLNIPI